MEQVNKSVFLSISDFLQLKQCGVYCLINKEKKYIQIFASRNMLDSLNNLMKIIETGQYGLLRNHLNEVEVEILEILSYTDKDINVKLSIWFNYYRSKGYTLYKDNNIVDYKIKDSTVIIKNSLYYSIYLENKRKGKVILGIFSTRDKAMEWKNTNYPSDIITNLVYADNDLSCLLNDIK